MKKYLFWVVVILFVGLGAAKVFGEAAEDGGEVASVPHPTNVSFYKDSFGISLGNSYDYRISYYVNQHMELNDIQLFYQRNILPYFGVYSKLGFQYAYENLYSVSGTNWIGYVDRYTPYISLGIELKIFESIILGLGEGIFITKSETNGISEMGSDLYFSLEAYAKYQIFLGKEKDNIIQIGVNRFVNHYDYYFTATYLHNFHGADYDFRKNILEKLSTLPEFLNFKKYPFFISMNALATSDYDNIYGWVDTYINNPGFNIQLEQGLWKRLSVILRVGGMVSLENSFVPALKIDTGLKYYPFSKHYQGLNLSLTYNYMKYYEVNDIELSLSEKYDNNFTFYIGFKKIFNNSWFMETGVSGNEYLVGCGKYFDNHNYFETENEQKSVKTTGFFYGFAKGTAVPFNDNHITSAPKNFLLSVNYQFNEFYSLGAAVNFYTYIYVYNGISDTMALFERDYSTIKYYMLNQYYYFYSTDDIQLYAGLGVGVSTGHIEYSSSKCFPAVDIKCGYKFLYNTSRFGTEALYRYNFSDDENFNMDYLILQFTYEIGRK